MTRSDCTYRLMTKNDVLAERAYRAKRAPNRGTLHPYLTKWPAGMPKALADDAGAGWDRLGQHGVTSWTVHPILPSFTNESHNNTPCHNSFKMFLRGGTSFKQRAPRGRVYTQLSVRHSQVRDEAFMKTAMRYWQFIVDPDISPWRHILKAAKPQLHINWCSLDKEQEASVKRVGAWSHVSLLMSAFDKYTDAMFNFLVATRMCVDRPNWLQSWALYQDVYDMTPVEAYYMMYRYVATKSPIDEHLDLGSGVSFSKTMRYHHQTSEPGAFVSLKKLQMGTKCVGGRVIDSRKRLWYEALDSNKTLAGHKHFPPDVYSSWKSVPSMKLAFKSKARASNCRVSSEYFTSLSSVDQPDAAAVIKEIDEIKANRTAAK